MKYRVWFSSVASSSVVVEADDASEAREKAEGEFPHPSICAKCAGWGEKYSMDLGEWELDESDDGVMAVDS